MRQSSKESLLQAIIPSTPEIPSAPVQRLQPALPPIEGPLRLSFAPEVILLLSKMGRDVG